MVVGFPSRYKLYMQRWSETHRPSLACEEYLIGTTKLLKQQIVLGSLCYLSNSN